MVLKVNLIQYVLNVVEKSNKDTLYVILLLVILFLLDMCVVGGVLLHGKANFPELIKHLKA